MCNSENSDGLCGGNHENPIYTMIFKLGNRYSLIDELNNEEVEG